MKLTKVTEVVGYARSDWGGPSVCVHSDSEWSGRRALTLWECIPAGAAPLGEMREGRWRITVEFEEVDG